MYLSLKNLNQGKYVGHYVLLNLIYSLEKKSFFFIIVSDFYIYTDGKHPTSRSRHCSNY
jgi:hypothetical protein